MDRYRNRWKDNHVDLSELKIYCIVAHGCRKPALIVLLTPSIVLLGSVGRGVQGKAVQEALCCDCSHVGHKPSS